MRRPRPRQGLVEPETAPFGGTGLELVRELRLLKFGRP